MRDAANTYPETWTDDEVAYARSLWEWDWGIAVNGRVLHHAARIVFKSEYGETGADALTSCGRKLWLHIPGIFTRLVAPRCNRCCDVLGVPRGVGSPKNDAACRRILEARAHD